ncbi:MAG: hypothetical protein GC149_05180 [Gammaproteobacteria bacterium]|nr:hypothetical protein [Gammaproteobacteria bacterium]
MTSDVPKFLVDEMLQRLGRWLRAAGYDTVIATNAAPDYYLLRQAIDEDRLLLTCDRELMQHRRAPEHVILLRGTTLEECVQELSRQLHLDWQYDPFSRCLVCNSLLLSATPEQQEQAPDSVTERELPALYCPTCQQVFWEGSHVKRMRHQLDTWQQNLG